jgi:hypothetical protein
MFLNLANPESPLRHPSIERKQADNYGGYFGPEDPDLATASRVILRSGRLAGLF